MVRVAPFIGAVLLAFSAFASAPAEAGLQCVPYARQLSGVDIRGNAHTWWTQADGRYARGTAPREGSVLAFRSTRAMPLGHVAVVSRIVSEREVILDHANWSRRGGIERSARAIDVSEAGDWSAVRVWHGTTGKMGLRTNPAYGFIYPDALGTAEPRIQMATRERTPLIGKEIFQLAALESTGR